MHRIASLLYADNQIRGASIRPQIVLKVEDLRLDFLRLHEEVAAVGKLILKTQVFYIGRLVDIATEKAHLHHIFPGHGGIVVQIVEHPLFG
jgi:hypothetical protein